ncbi:3 -phosphoadenosine 5 -phosphosulfate sulfotransferase (PAPS reductase) [Micractinium conductrix]|uniref:3 -phosphoadenosine 5 -phosphosulfate sulfotransferase (PAPS reductase) n=1 Tax=Micractinium conductrix TaxID=554055 RepID=A0A2P6VAV1_9CHLO|nr:3 -phosphoadenosine 5 -phosphosulfate sulfotransferase (PAPS reductase) [Micractinium conductrix]|eukprot:PSC71220.1 3 -phosphoadenosine 5 -phosphosulfate sulfotransferase (PAPS reductase) [Micractinium conductrix]
MEAPKAAICVIGDEVLAGSITDANTPWLAKVLTPPGLILAKAFRGPSPLQRDICDTVLRLKERVGPSGFVFTSGGIGPTHDDITYTSIAAAFGCHLELHQPTVARMQEHYDKRGVELNEARLRMAHLPTDDGVEVLFTPGLWVPLVAIQGVYILPGIPRLFQQMIEAHAGRFRGPAAHARTLYTNTGEGDLAAKLGSIAALHPAVRIGSYPNVSMGLGAGEAAGPGSFKVKLQFESRNTAALDTAVAAVEEALDTFTM